MTQRYVKDVEFDFHTGTSSMIESTARDKLIRFGGAEKPKMYLSPEAGEPMKRYVVDGMILTETWDITTKFEDDASEKGRYYSNIVQDRSIEHNVKSVQIICREVLGDGTTGEAFGFTLDKTSALDEQGFFANYFDYMGVYDSAVENGWGV